MVTLNNFGRSVSGACLYWFLHGSTNLWCHLLSYAGFWFSSELIIPHLPAPPNAPYQRQQRSTPSTAMTPHPINGDAAPPQQRGSLTTALLPSTTPLLMKTMLTDNTDNLPPSQQDARRSLTTRRSPLPLDETLAAPSRQDARRSLTTTLAASSQRRLTTTPASL
jgi:hypothetical protein